MLSFSRSKLGYLYTVVNYKMWSIELAGLFALLVVFITHWIYRRSNPKLSNGVLPPGSMGFPLIGESLQLIIPSYSLDLPPFLKTRLRRYGRIFRTSVAGRPVVVSADPEFNYFILQQEGRLVEIWYLDLFSKIFNLGSNRPNDAQIAKYMRNVTLSHFGADSLKTKLLAQLQQMVTTTLSGWAGQKTVEVKLSASIMALEYGAKLLFSLDNEKLLNDLSQKYINFARGLMAFPINIPGTAYHKCFEDHKKALGIMLSVLNERRASTGSRYGDVLDHVIEDMDVEAFVTQDFISNLMFGLLFVTFDSVSTTLALAFKLLAENPSVLEELTAEHEELLKSRGNPDAPITWEEYKSMNFTRYVINETLRLGGVSPGLLRRARTDIEVNGYTIPKGWAIMILNSALQLDPNTFEDPLAFNPWRWKDLKANVVSKHFMPFGAGMKQCAGAEYTRVLLSLFFHVLVTKYRWTKIEGGDVARTPILRFKSALKIEISKKDI